MKYKVKRRWWMWALGIFINVFAITGTQVMVINRDSPYSSGNVYFWIYIVLFIDIFVILPDASHLYFVIEHGGTLIIKRALISDIIIPCHTITMLEVAPLLTFGGFGVKIMEDSFGGTYKITYTKRGRRKVAIISPKDPQFMKELVRYVDETAVLFNNTDTVFKNKKINNDSDKK
jgi:hypothetical protein